MIDRVAAVAASDLLLWQTTVRPITSLFDAYPAISSNNTGDADHDRTGDIKRPSDALYGPLYTGQQYSYREVACLGLTTSMYYYHVRPHPIVAGKAN